MLMGRNDPEPDAYTKERRRRGQFIPWTKSTWTIGLGPVQVVVSWRSIQIPESTIESTFNYLYLFRKRLHSLLNIMSLVGV